MQLLVFRHNFAIIIGIAVQTSVSACVIGADIRAQQTIALFSRRFLLRHKQLTAKGFFQHGFGHAAVGVYVFSDEFWIFTA